jgi:DNA (cytosine-5)-methyltransferase 1
MKILDLFAGMGGNSLAAQQVWPEIEHVFCEIDSFCQAVLRKHWPNSQIYGDIRTLTNTPPVHDRKHPRIADEGQKSKPRISPLKEVFLVTGGFPCQPFSAAGKRKGTDDDRHLWPEMRRVIQEFSPRWVVAENVRVLLSINGGLVFEQVCLDLEALGYEVQPFVIPACAVNAPHRRDRVWIVAYCTGERRINGSDNRKGRQILHNENGDASQSESQRSGWDGRACAIDGASPDSVSDGERSAYRREIGKRVTGWKDENKRKGNKVRSNIANGDHDEEWEENWSQVATRLCPLDDGLPNGLARPKGWRNAALKAAGNSIVPQVAVEIFKAIKAVDSL